MAGSNKNWYKSEFGFIHKNEVRYLKKEFGIFGFGLLEHTCHEIGLNPSTRREDILGSIDVIAEPPEQLNAALDRCIELGLLREVEGLLRAPAIDKVERELMQAKLNGLLTSIKEPKFDSEFYSQFQELSERPPTDSSNPKRVAYDISKAYWDSLKKFERLYVKDRTREEANLYNGPEIPAEPIDFIERVLNETARLKTWTANLKRRKESGLYETKSRT